MRTTLRAGGALALAAATLLLPAPASALSCVGPQEWMPTAEHVFVGHVTDVRGDAVRFRVAEVWQGPDLAPTLWLTRETEMDMWFPFSGPDGEVRDGYADPQRYAVGLRDGVRDGARLGPCDLWPVEEEMEYGVTGQQDPREPVPSGENGDPPAARTAQAGLLGGGAAALAVAGGLVWWLVRRLV